MKAHYLFPYKYKFVGWIFLIIGIIVGIFSFIKDYETDILIVKVLAFYNDDSFFREQNGFFKIIENSIVDEIAVIAVVVGGILVGFSKEKIEDEFIQKLRLDSLVWAIIVNYVVLLFATVFVYGFNFFDVLVFNMFTPLLFYIVRFNVLKSRL